MIKYLYEVYNSLKGLKKWGETTRVKKWGETTRVLGRNDKGIGAKCLGIKFGAKRPGAKRLGANWSWGETTCCRIKIPHPQISKAR